ncbi:hypothetical protein B0G75_12023 [Paraburkholderia sp. BL18I3N2]|nr:hypothetical protein B0G75_12023 [Paraburkholderia sp. BL18I3N2]PRX90720.1 hypothetical protein B0G73_14217 [Paraburkholderia sp. BL25I1N1]
MYDALQLRSQCIFQVSGYDYNRNTKEKARFYAGNE